MTEVAKQDVVAYRNSLITQVSAKTAYHDLKALKILFKRARRDGVVNEDPTATTLLHEAGVPTAVAQALIGHVSKAKPTYRSVAKRWRRQQQLC
jgi:hypothetical protein